MLYKKGAEANLYLETWFGKEVIRKHRYQKTYRNSKLDYYLRKFRTVNEAKLLLESRKIGVPTPFIYSIDLKDTSLYLEFIKGEQVKKVLYNLPNMIEICELIGKNIGILHNNNIIHGDLTTSNMILTQSNILYFIDFGLGSFSPSIEDKGVDLHLMQKAFESTHYKYAEKCFNAVLSGYKKIINSDVFKNILLKLDEISMRGRYFDRSEANEE